jgi:hypothetical protein
MEEDGDTFILPDPEWEDIITVWTQANLRRKPGSSADSRAESSELQNEAARMIRSKCQSDNYGEDVKLDFGNNRYADTYSHIVNNHIEEANH